MTAPTPLNGHEANSLEDLRSIGERLDREITAECDSIRRMLESEQALRNQVEAILKIIGVREKRLQRALVALEGGLPGRKPKAEERKRNTNTWRISDEKIQGVYAVVVELGEARTRQIHERTGYAMESIRRALANLREEEKVRVIKRDRKQGDTYALMPDAEVADAA